MDCRRPKTDDQPHNTLRNPALLMEHETMRAEQRHIGSKELKSARSRSSFSIATGLAIFWTHGALGRSSTCQYRSLRYSALLHTVTARNQIIDDRDRNQDSRPDDAECR